MKNFILVSDSFKGTLEAAQVCQIQEAVIRRHIPDAQIRSIPMADGGEGMVASYLYIMGGQQKTVTVTAPLGGTTNAVYGILPDGSAVMEMAAAAGLPLVSGRENPLEATTKGVGELILNAAASGVKKILLGLGAAAPTIAASVWQPPWVIVSWTPAETTWPPSPKTLASLKRLFRPWPCLISPSKLPAT